MMTENQSKEASTMLRLCLPISFSEAQHCVSRSPGGQEEDQWSGKNEISIVQIGQRHRPHNSGLASDDMRTL